jgi:hypothetical protein
LLVSRCRSLTIVLRSLSPKYSGPAMAVRGGGGRFSPAAMRWVMVALMRFRICGQAGQAGRRTSRRHAGGQHEHDTHCRRCARTVSRTQPLPQLRQRTTPMKTAAMCGRQDAHVTEGRTKGALESTLTAVHFNSEHLKSIPTWLQHPVQLLATTGSSSLSLAVTMKVGEGQNLPPSPMISHSCRHSASVSTLLLQAQRKQTNRQGRQADTRAACRCESAVQADVASACKPGQACCAFPQAPA